MSIIKTPDKLKITISLVDKLILEQFPQGAELPIIPVERGGLDNITFRLGEEMLIRLPSTEGLRLESFNRTKMVASFCAAIIN